MLRENVQWFGEIARTDPVVTCAGADAGASMDAAEAADGGPSGPDAAAADGGAGGWDSGTAGADAGASTAGEDASSSAGGKDAAGTPSVDGGHLSPVDGACGCASAPAGFLPGLGLLLAALCQRRRHSSPKP